MQFIPIDQAVASCRSIIKSSSREDDLIIRMWVWLAEKQIGCSKATIKTATKNFTDLTAEKPSDHLYTIDLALISNDGSDITYKYRGYNKRIHPISATNDPSAIDVYEDENCFHLSSNGSGIDELNVKYWAYPLDENCDPLIPEYHLYAIMRFVKFMDAERKDEAQSKIDRLSTEWKIQASKARAKNKMPDIPEAKEILKRWMTLIPDMYYLDSETY